MKLLGCDVLITSNAVGGMNSEYNIGDIVIVNDHINLIGGNPLIGPNDQSFGERFVDMSEVYDKEVIDYIINQKFDFKIHQGVLACLSGPTYETPAEYRWLKTIGSDIVGMSTVPEIIVAKHMNMRCFSMSVITDLGVTGNITKVSHDIVKIEAEKASEKMTFILKNVIKKYNEIKNPLN
jgi:purine-nucleoside phosphorylase